ncbi:hypothetical protein GCM10027159_04990 [Lysobacter terrae]
MHPSATVDYPNGTTSHESPVWVWSCEITSEPRGGWTGGHGDGNGRGDGTETSGNEGDDNDNGDQAAVKDCGKAPVPDQVAGNPVVIANGNKIEKESDFGTGGEMALHLSRTWNMLWDGNGLFGSNWNSSFDYRLSFGTKSRFGPVGTCYARPSIVECADTTSHTDIWAHRPDGRMIHFIKNASDGIYYESKPSPISKIVRQADGTLLLSFENNMVESYSKGGYPLWIQDEHGVRWSFTYGGMNGTQVQRVTHTNGRYVQFVWVGDELREVRDPAGTPYTFTYTGYKYDSYNNPLIGLHTLKSTTLPGTPATVITYHYSGEAGESLGGGLTGKSFNGVRYSWFSYSGGRASSTEHAAGVERYTFAYTPGANGAMSVLVTNPLGKQATYDFLNEKPIAITGHPSSHCPLTGSNYSYDANGYLDKRTDNNGNITDYDYNAAGQLVKRVEAFGRPEARTTTYAWASNLISTETVVGHSQASYVYTADGRIASVTAQNLSPVGVANQAFVTTFTYTKYANGLLATKTADGPLPGAGDAVVSNYDTYGNLTSVQNSLGHTTSYSNYNALGLPGRVTGANGDMTDYVYDLRGRKTEEKHWINSAWQTTAYTYDGSGRLASIQLPDGQVRNFEYDAAWRLIREYQEESPGIFAQKRYTYNNLSLVTRVDTERATVPVSAPVLSTPGSSANGSYTVSWTSVADTTGYRLEENSNGGAWTEIQNAAATSIAISGKTNGTYGYRVRACNVTGCSAYSSTASVVVTLSGPPVIPSLGASTNYSTTGMYTLTWNSVPGATSYQLSERKNAGAWVQIYNSTGTTTGRNNPNGTYDYQVRACNTYGCSAYSTIVTVTVEKEACPSCLMAPAPEQTLSIEGDGGNGP